jgi:hypothetical protein
LRIIVHSDVSGRPLLTAVDRRGAGKDVTYITEDPRTFFLVIESEDLEWSVEVAEGIPARRQKRALLLTQEPAKIAFRLMQTMSGCDGLSELVGGLCQTPQ